MSVNGTSDTLSILLNSPIQVKSQATYRTTGETLVQALTYANGVKTPRLLAGLRRALKSLRATLPARYKKLTAKGSYSGDCMPRKLGPSFLYLAFSVMDTATIRRLTTRMLPLPLCAALHVGASVCTLAPASSVLVPTLSALVLAPQSSVLALSMHMLGCMSLPE